MGSARDAVHDALARTSTGPQPRPHTFAGEHMLQRIRLGRRQAVVPLQRRRAARRRTHAARRGRAGAGRPVAGPAIAACRRCMRAPAQRRCARGARLALGALCRPAGRPFVGMRPRGAAPRLFPCGRCQDGAHAPAARVPRGLRPRRRRRRPRLPLSKAVRRVRCEKLGQRRPLLQRGQAQRVQRRRGRLPALPHARPVREPERALRGRRQAAGHQGGAERAAASGLGAVPAPPAGALAAPGPGANRSRKPMTRVPALSRRVYARCWQRGRALRCLRLNAKASTSLACTTRPV
jgi:hypothetical protein